MNMTSETRQDTATEDAETIRGRRPNTTLVVPEALARLGYEAMPFGVGNLWDVHDDQYIYRPLRAWDAAQAEVDAVIKMTGGSVFTLASAMLSIMRATATIQPEIDEETGKPETEDTVNRIRGSFWLEKSSATWTSFLAACPEFKLASFARDMVVKCGVHRLPTAAEQAKDDADPTKDHGGKLFEIKGAGSVDNFYKGRRQQVMRIGLAAFWGSCGDFFVGR